MLRVLFCLMIAAGPAMAGPDRIAFHLGSYHAGASRSFEEVNPGIFLSWDSGNDVSYSLGAFRNSYGRGSVAATAARTFFRGKTTALSVFGGIAHYPGNGNDIRHAIGDFVPIAGLQMHYRNLFVNLMPGDGDAADAIFSFGVTYSLGDQ